MDYKNYLRFYYNIEWLKQELERISDDDVTLHLSAEDEQYDIEDGMIAFQIDFSSKFLKKPFNFSEDAEEIFIEPVLILYDVEDSVMALPEEPEGIIETENLKPIKFKTVTILRRLFKERFGT